LPPLPPDENLAAVRGLMTLDTLRATLLERFPDDFAGLVAEGDGFTIMTTGRQDEIEAFVDDFSADLMTDHAVAITPPTFSYRTATHSLRSLRDLMSEMVSARESLETEGVLGVGVDEVRNVVTVAIDQPRSDMADRLSARFDSDAVRVVVGEPTTLLGRFDDTSPFNAGNLLAATDGQRCTSGFGMHGTTGGTYGTTAGHCGQHEWYNGLRFVGVSFINDYRPGQRHVDVQSLSGATSKLFWKGNPGTREWVAGYSNPQPGTMVCSEGAVGYEKCGVVGIVGWQDLNNGALGFIYEGDCPIDGDSGGPIIWPTGYGFIAVGTVRGRTDIPGVGLLCFGTNMLDISWVLAATPNTLTSGP